MTTKHDVTALAGAVGREVRQATREGAPVRVVVATRLYDTDVDDAWDALTNPERIPRWFAPIEGELRLGGRYQIKGNAGGTITACEPPRRFAATWELGGGMSWLEIRLAPEGERTRLTLEHAAPIDDKSEEFWEKFGPGAVGVGWDLGLLGLQLHLAAGGAAITEEGMAWAMSDEGKRFARLVSDGWREASIAFGTDPEQARASAARTVEFYTGGP